MRYLVVALMDELTSERKEMLHKAADHRDDILCPEVGGVGASYLYIRESCVQSLFPRVKGIVPCMSLCQYITSEEARAFLSRLEDSDRIKQGDFVKVSGYGDMVFVVEELGSGSKPYRVKSDIRNKEVVLGDLRKTQIRPHRDASYYVYTNVQPEVDGVLTVDVDYLQRCGCVDFSNYVSLVNFFLRLKLQVRRKMLCFSFLSDVPPKLLELLRVFGLAYTTGCLSQGDLLFSDRLYHLYHFHQGVFRYDLDTSQIELLDDSLLPLPVEKMAFIYYYTYLRESGKCSTFFSESDLIRRCLFEDWASFVRSCEDRCPELRDFYVLGNMLVQPKIFSYEPARVDDFIESQRMVWFKENVDYYTNLIRG